MPLILIFNLQKKLCLSQMETGGRPHRPWASGASGDGSGSVGSARRVWRQRLPAAGLVACGAAAGLGTRHAVRGLWAWGARTRTCGGRYTSCGRRRLSSGPRPPKSRRPTGCCGMASRRAAGSRWLVALRARHLAAGPRAPCAGQGAPAASYIWLACPCRGGIFWIFLANR